MLYIKLTPLSNGAHDNQRADQPLAMHEGWALVPPELEEKAWSYLPFIDLTLYDGQIVGVAQGPIPDPEPEPDPEPTAEERLRADVDYIAAMTGVML